MGVEAWAVAWGKCLSLALDLTYVLTLQMLWPFGAGLRQVAKQRSEQFMHFYSCNVGSSCFINTFDKF